MKLSALFTILISVISFKVFAVGKAAVKSQNDMVHINLKLPSSMVTAKGLVGVSLDRIDLANKAVNSNSEKNRKCDLCDFFTSGHPPEKSNTSLSFTYGNGKTFTKDPNEGGDQQWDFDLRLSQAIGDGCTRIDTGILNEGHPVNHHRDGFYLQLTCRKEVLKNITAELGVGPYLSMDTTKPQGGSELDQKGLNILATAALNYYIGKSGLHLRIECDGVKSTLPTSGPDSIQCLAGIGQDFSAPKSASSDSSSDALTKNNYSVEVGPTWSKTNHGGTSSAIGGNVSISKYNENWMTRLGILTTGDDGAINNRKGIYADVNYRVPIGSEGKDFLYTGAGVYLNRNYRSERTEVDGKLTFLGYEHKLGKNNAVRIEYGRIFPFSDAPRDENEGDADVANAQFVQDF